MRSQVVFPVLSWGFFLEGEDSHGDHGLGSLVELRFKASPGTVTVLLFFFCVLYCSLFLYCTVSACVVRSLYSVYCLCVNVSYITATGCQTNCS
jgi:hypothetical protein